MDTARWMCPAWPGRRMGPVDRDLRTRLRRAWRAGEHGLWPDVALAAVLSLAAAWLTLRGEGASGGGDVPVLPPPEPSARPLPPPRAPPRPAVGGRPRPGANPVHPGAPDLAAPLAAGLPGRPVRRPAARR